MLDLKKNEFVRKLQSIYPDQWQSLIRWHNSETRKSFRVNVPFLEEYVISTLNKEGILIEPAFFERYYTVTSSSFNRLLSTCEAFIHKMIYIQEISSASPAFLARDFSESDGLRILDLCAAPGSKTTLICQIFRNSEVHANEPNKKRFFKLRQILNDYGCTNVCLLSYDGIILPHKKDHLKNSFDIVFVDVPCSNESKIRLDTGENLIYWSRSEPKRLSKIQKGLINSGFSMLKPGGILVYSTCTYSVEENEMVIDWFLQKNLMSARILKLKRNFENFLPGLTKYGSKVFNPQISLTRRIVPNGQWTGFFLAIIGKMIE